MQDVLYNSRSKSDKRPYGTALPGEKVKLGIRLATALEACKVYLIIKNDSDGTTDEQMLEMLWCQADYTRFQCEIDAPAQGLYWYCFRAETRCGTRFVGKCGSGAYLCEASPAYFQMTVCSSDYTTPEWIMGGGFYHIFVDRFNRGGNHPVKDGGVFHDDWSAIPNYKPDDRGEIRNNDFFGGDLEGITQKLPYINELGISCIYLSPIFEAASNHKYDTSDYLKIDPAFGDDENFKNLCEEAKKLGISVILDGVFNHTGSDSVYFNRLGRYGEGGAYKDKNSPYYQWYNFADWPDSYDAWWGINTLPQVHEENEGFMDFILGDDGVLHKWMDLGASGWRLDVADELPDVFLENLRRSVKSKNPDALIIGEVWEDASSKIAYSKRRHYFQGGQLDSVMNYPFKNAIIDYMKTGNAEAIAETVETICENYPRPALNCLMNALGTHDTARIITVLCGKSFDTRDERAAERLDIYEYEQAKAKLMIASMLQCTLPGVPCIYYGDEVGLQGYEDPFNRRCYPWGNEDTQLLAWYKSLMSARRSCAAFAGGDYETVHMSDGVYGFTRKNGKCVALTIVNLGSDSVFLEIDEENTLLLQHGCNCTDISISIPQGGAAIIEINSAPC